MIKKLLAGLLAIMIICSPLLIFPYESFGQTAGDTLGVRTEITELKHSLQNSSSKPCRSRLISIPI